MNAAESAIPAPPSERAVMSMRTPLPISTDVCIRPGQCAVIKTVTGARPFAPERVFVGAGHIERKRSWWMRLLKIDHPAGRGAADWIVHDITIDNRSQLATCGSLPGDMFANTAVDVAIQFDVCEPRAEVCVIVEYIGPHRKGAPFVGAILGLSPVVHSVRS